MRLRSRAVARGERLPSELIQSTRLRRARRRMTCFFDSGSPDQSLAKQTMSRPSRCGMAGLRLGHAALRELLIPELEHQERPELGREIGSRAVALDQRSHVAQIEAI